MSVQALRCFSCQSPNIVCEKKNETGLLLPQRWLSEVTLPTSLPYYLLQFMNTSHMPHFRAAATHKKWCKLYIFLAAKS